MAATSVTDVNKVEVRVMVDKERNKVVYAEAGKDFIDVLFSFFTLPLGTIARLVSKESNIEPVKFGSLSSLYQSLTDFDEQYLCTPTCKEMLLNPRNSMAEYCRKLKFNIDETQPMQYFICATWECNRRDNGSLLSTFRNQKCTCGKVMDHEEFRQCLNVENGFVKETATFIISDDLIVMPNVYATIVNLLQKLGFDSIDTLQEQTVEISKKEVIDLLKYSLFSKNPLTDFVFKKEFHGNSNPILQSDFWTGNMVPTDDSRQMYLKIMTRKSNGEILFAEAEEEFADLLFSFLTFPLGGVLHMLEGFTFLCSLSNLYESMKELSPDRYFISQDLKDKIVKPKIASQFDLTNQILPIGASSLPVFYCHTYCSDKTSYKYFVDLTTDMVHSKNSCNGIVEMCVPFTFVAPSSSCPGEFVKKKTTYMVTDELVVTPMSATSALSYMKRSKVPLSDMEEVVITIGIKEGLALLKASLISPTALTNGLSQFIGTITNSVKKEHL